MLLVVDSCEAARLRKSRSGLGEARSSGERLNLKFVNGEGMATCNGEGMDRCC